MLGFVLLSLPVGFLLALPLTAILVRMGRRLGTVDSPGVGGHQKVLRDVPNIGGIGITVAAVGPLLLCLILLLIVGAEGISSWFSALGSFADRLSTQQNAWWSIVVGAILLHLTGLWDDRRPLSPWPKLIVQILVALGVVFLGAKHKWENFPILAPPSKACY